jgi:hypothetical protein
MKLLRCVTVAATVIDQVERGERIIFIDNLEQLTYAVGLSL